MFLAPSPPGINKVFLQYYSARKKTKRPLDVFGMNRGKSCGSFWHLSTIDWAACPFLFLLLLPPQQCVIVSPSPSLPLLSFLRLNPDSGRSILQDATRTF